MSPFELEDYRKIVKHLIEEKKQTDPKCNFAKLAEEINVQRAFVSQVLNGKNSFTSDQIYSISNYLKLSSIEEEYLQKLVAVERSGLKNRKDQLRKECKVLKKQLGGNQKAMTKADIHQKKLNEAWQEYYGDHFCSLIHMYLTIPAYLAQPDLVRQRLNISQEKLNSVFKILDQCGLIKIKGNSIKLISDKVFLPANDRHLKLNALKFRSLSQFYCQSSEKPKDTFFTLTFSSNEETQTAIREKFNNFMKEIEPIITASNEEQVYQMNFDLFEY